MDDQNWVASWSDHVRNLSIAAVQIATIGLILSYAGFNLAVWWRNVKDDLNRWMRQREFEAFYALAWPRRRAERHDETDGE